jgi:hypothetical protein
MRTLESGLPIQRQFFYLKIMKTVLKNEHNLLLFLENVMIAQKIKFLI